MQELLSEVQSTIFQKALAFREENTKRIDDYETFKEFMEAQGGFALSHWCGSDECEARISEETKATIRVIPFDREPERGRCVLCGGESEGRVVFAKAY